jgi:hypothetical protein
MHEHARAAAWCQVAICRAWLATHPEPHAPMHPLALAFSPTDEHRSSRSASTACTNRQYACRMVSNSVGRRQDAVVARSTFCMPPCFGALPSKRASAQPAQISVRIARGRATEAAPGCRRMTSTPAQRGQRRATLRITHTEWAMRCVGQSASAIDLIGFCAHADGGLLRRRLGRDVRDAHSAL